MEKSNKIAEDSLVDLIFHLKWKSDVACHTDGYQANRVNIWRDFLPPMLLDVLMNKEAGERLQVPLNFGEVVESFTQRNLVEIQSSRFHGRFKQRTEIEPRMGRFYPQGMLNGIPGVFKANIQSFRCVGLNNGQITVDFNHPLADKDLHLSVVIGRVERKTSERGGESIDWMGKLTAGPGMQSRWQKQETDYFAYDAFERDDDQSDTLFYEKPRFVQHIDATAREVVKNTYGRFLTENMDVLDLMSSWVSHLPANLNFKRLVGLGLNRDELKRNSQLKDFLIHDLNADPKLSFESNTFDAVVNTVSIEYLTNPLVVFNEVKRVLRPDGYFIVTFSNRWFPTKAVKIWQEIHEFERMGLVLEYFMSSGGFKDLQTYSIRGLPRPHNDQYFPELRFSDPVYAVWGRKK